MDRNNVVGIVGYLEKVYQGKRHVYGSLLRKIMLRVPRKSDVEDRVMVMIPDEAVNELNGVSVFDMNRGDKVMLIGRMQTQRNKETKRCKIFVFADYIAPAEPYAEIQNTVRLRGIIAREPVYRETPLGRKITDVILLTESVFAEGRYAFVPVVAWADIAEQIAELTPGRIIEVYGRFQSRGYTKQLPDGTTESRTAYEVSINSMRKKGMMEKQMFQIKGGKEDV